MPYLHLVSYFVFLEFFEALYGYAHSSQLSAYVLFVLVIALPLRDKEPSPLVVRNVIVSLLSLHIAHCLVFVYTLSKRPSANCLRPWCLLSSSYYGHCYNLLDIFVCSTTDLVA